MGKCNVTVVSGSMRAYFTRRIFFVLGLFSIIFVTNYLLNFRHLWELNIPQISRVNKYSSTKNLKANSPLVQPTKVSWFNWQNFSSTSCEDAADPLPCASEILLKPWKADNKKIKYLKKIIESSIPSNSNPILTKKNVKQDKKLHFGKSKYRKKRGVLKKELYQNLPNYTSLGSGELFKSCSVVGSSGILLNSSCGKAIDESDYIFRCNIPPLKPFSKDAGIKSNLSTMNLKSIAELRYSHFETEEMKNKFLTDMKEYQGYLWIIPFSTPLTLKVAKKAIPNLGDINSIEKTNKLIIAMQNPEQMLQMENFLKKFANFEKTITTGFILTIWALTLCEETTLYGFWPFTEIIKNGFALPLKFHYYDSANFTEAVQKTHSMSQEFHFLLKLHQYGILKIQHEKC